MVKTTAKAIKIIKTCNLYLCFIFLGLCVTLPGPTLLDLQDMVNTDTKSIAIIYTAKAVGYVFGSMVGGVVFDMTSRKQLVMTILNLIPSLTMLAIPWSRSIVVLTSFMVLNGITLGGLDTGCNVCCLSLWGKDNGPFYQALHFTFGFGGLIAPLVAAPFLVQTDPTASNSFGSNIALQNSTLQYTLENSSSNSISSTILPITYPYSIIGCFGLFVTALFLMVCIVSPIDVSGRQTGDAKVKKRSLTFTLTLVAMNVTMIFVATGTEIGYAQMLTTYAVKGPLKLSKSVGSYMTSTYFASFTIARLITVFLAIKLSSFTLIVFDITCTSIGAAVLFFLGATEEWALWLASVILGVGVASFFPSAVGWTENYITVTNKIASGFTIGAAMGEMVLPFVISQYIEEEPKVLLYIVPVSCILSAIITFFMYLMLRNMGTKYTTEEELPNVTFTSKTEEGQPNAAFDSKTEEGLTNAAFDSKTDEERPNDAFDLKTEEGRPNGAFDSNFNGHYKVRRTSG